MFFEDVFLYKRKEDKISRKRTHETTFRDEGPSEPTIDAKVEPRRSKRLRISKSFGPDFVAYAFESEPQIFKEVMFTPEVQMWKEAVNSEIKSILSNHTWELANLPPDSKLIRTKWIFKRKKNLIDFDKYKARLVAKDYRQKEGFDYFDTYSLVTRITSIRMLIAIAVLHNLDIHQMDVNTAFLNGELNEEIYMEQPEGFIVKGQNTKCVNWSSPSTV